MCRFKACVPSENKHFKHMLQINLYTHVNENLPSGRYFLLVNDFAHFELNNCCELKDTVEHSATDLKADC